MKQRPTFPARMDSSVSAAKAKPLPSTHLLQVQQAAPRVVDLQAGIDPRPIEERIVIGREAATPTPASRP